MNSIINNDIINTLKGYTADIQNEVKFILQNGSHSKRDELVDFLKSVSSISDKISFEEKDLAKVLRSPISFTLEVNGKLSGIIFSGIPGGHEFNSFILALLQCGGSDLKLDNSIIELISNIKDDLKFEVFISLSCQNCPEVVQALNKFASINNNISNEMIDGGLFQEIIDKRNIQGVPSIYLNGELFLNGRVDLAKIINKLQELYPYLTNSKSESLPLQDVVIIGGGPAGISAAIYSARKGLKVTLVAEIMGGQVKDTMGIENLTSVSSTTGPELTGAMYNHLNDYDISVKEHHRVLEISKGDIKNIKLSSGEDIKSKTIIIATGANWRELNIPGEKENLGNGVAYCPHCDGPFFKNKDICVVGGGNSGIEAALDLSGIAKSVKVFEFLPNLKADKILIDQANSRENIETFCNVECKEIHSTDGKVSGISYKDRESNEIKKINLEGIFVQIGLIPNSVFLKGVIDLNNYGEVIVSEKGETSYPGIFACGDVTTVPHKQIIISMGEGAKAANTASEYLQTFKIEEYIQESA
jgi:alkyl hydroperoxide reductase subunit F